MRRYLYYPGCSLDSTAREYRASLEAVCGELGLELCELAGWSCCGSSAAHGAGPLLSAGLAARNLNLAAAQAESVAPAARPEPADLVAPCASCYSRLRRAQADLGKNEDLRQEVSAALGQPWRGGAVRVRSLLEVLAEDVGPDRVAARVTVPLGRVKVASYYGCLLVRPSGLGCGDDPEDPVSMDRLVAATGAVPVAWSHKVECCGAGLGISRRDIVQGLVGEIAAAAVEAGAEVLVTACPMCHANLDSRQGGAVRGRRGAGPAPAAPPAPASSPAPAPSPVPVLYLTQWLGLALGLSPRSLGLGSHLTSTAGLRNRIGTGGRR